MSILISHKGNLEIDRKFSKELFTEVLKNLKAITDEEWETTKDTIADKKVLIAAYVRTNVDNLVLMIDKDKFASVSNIPPFIVDSGIYPNILVDTGLVCSKSLIDQAFHLKSAEAMRRLVMNSTCYPVGAVETSKKYIIVFNVVLSVDLLADKDIVLNQGFFFRPIETLHLTDELQRDISESLVIVKSEDKNK